MTDIGFGLAVVVAFGCCVWAYLSTFVRRMVTQSASTPIVAVPSRDPVEDREPAYQMYFAGQAVADIRLIWRESFRRVLQFVDYGRAQLDRAFFQTWHGNIRRLFGVCVAVWLGLGAVVGGMFALTLPLVHAAVVATLHVLALVTIALLRVVDASRLLIRRIRINCPSCHEPVPYPDYACPADGCGRRHRKIRPGRYGIVRRVCVCGARLPTLLLLGSGTMAGYCPRCQHSLTEFSGSAVEVVLPVIGPTAAGKTQLMLTMIAALAELAEERGQRLTLADDETRRRYEQQRAALVEHQPTRPTTTDLPRSYAVHIGASDAPHRLVHVLDAAGERFLDSVRFQEHRLLSLARSVLFVVDLCATEQFLRLLRPNEMALLDRRPGNVPAPEHVLQQAVDNMEQMGVDLRRCQVAVVFSKRDIVERLSPFRDVATGALSLERWAIERLGLGSMVRLLNQSFANVDYFATEANITHHGVHHSVMDLALWFARGDMPRLIERRRVA